MGRKIYFALAFLRVTFSVSAGFLDQKIQLLQDVLEIRNARYLNVYNCWERPDALRIYQFFSSNNRRTNFQKIGANASYVFDNAFAYVLDATCKEMEDVLFQFSSKQEFKGDRRWYVLTEEGLPERNVVHLFKQLRLRMDSDVSLLIYKLHGKGISLSINPRGTPSNSSSALNSVRYRERSDMTGLTLKVSLDGVPTTPRAEAMEKLSLTAIFLLQDVHNFSTLLVPAGKTNDSDQLLPGTLAFVNEEVVTGYDLLVPAYPFRQCFVYKRSETSKNEYLAPFSSTVWYCVLSLAILVCVVMKLVLHLEEEEGECRGVFSWTTAFLILISVYSQQGTSVVPTYTAGRIVILCLLVISVHLYNSYVSTIVSSLLYPSVSVYKSPDELIHDNFKLGFEEMDFNPYLKYNSGFVFTNDSVRYKNKRYRYYDVTEGLGKVRKGQFAFFAEVALHYPTLSKSFGLSEVCELKEFDVFPKLYPVLVAPKHSQYSELFKISSRRIVEQGILQRKVASLLAKQPPCLGIINVKQLSINYVSPAFILLGVGVAASMVCLLLEICLFCAMKSSVARKEAKKELKERKTGARDLVK